MTGFDYADFYATHREDLVKWLIDNGFKQSPKSEHMFSYWYRDDNTTMYMDFRNNSRRTYAFKRGTEGAVKHEGFKLYLEYKDFEEKLKDKFKGISTEDPLVVEEDMTNIHETMPPIGGDQMEEIMYHLNGLLEALKLAQVSHHADNLRELLKKSGYKMRNE